jgi:DeoR/GlpR family transcriptional regulator of sugar metabolism
MGQRSGTATQSGGARGEWLLPAQRQLRLAELLITSDAVSLDDLARTFGVSTQTVRRDLALLERQGLVRRTFGGAVTRAAITVSEPAFVARDRAQAAEKRAIARAALALLTPGESLFLDASTTALALARVLPDDWTGEVVATSLPVAAEMARRPGVRLILVGGEFRHSSRSFSGPLAQEMLERLHVRVACMSARGLDLQHGISEAHAGEAALKRIVLARTERTIGLVDSSKLGCTATHLVAPLGALDTLVTDDRAEVALLAGLRAAIRLVVAPIAPSVPEPA